MTDETRNVNIDDSANPPPSTNCVTPPDSNGWDGKLRVERRAEVVNAEILSDPEYSDEDAPPVEQINADDGRSEPTFPISLLTKCSGRSIGRL